MSLGRGGIFGDPRSQFEKEQEAQMLRMLSPGVRAQIEQSQEASGGLLGGLSPDTQSAVNDYAQMDGLLAPQQEEKPAGFWQGGKKFGTRDGLAGLLAVIGDVAAQQSGGEAGAVNMLTGSRKSALDEFKEEAKQQRKMQELYARMRAAGVPENEAQAQLYGFKPRQQHDLEKLAGIMNDPNQSVEVRDGARQRLAGEPFISTTLPNGQFVMGRPSQISGMMGGGGMADQTPAIEDGYQYTPGPGGRANQANWRQVGGGTGNGVGGFPGR